MRLLSIKPVFVILLSAFAFSSCLKDKDYDNFAIQSVHSDADQKFVEIKLSAGAAENFLSISIAASNKDTIMELVPVNITSAAPAAEDIKVTLVQNDKLVADYNNLNGTAYMVPTNTMFKVQDGGIVTIPKGQHTGYLKIKFKPSDFLGGDYAIGYSISSVDKTDYKLTANLNNGIVAIVIKNKYDGHYRVTGTFKDLSNATFTGRYPMDVYLITQDGTSVAMFDNAIGTYAHSFLNAGSTSYYGSFSPQFRFDATDKVISVVNAYGQPSGNGRSGELDLSGVNKFNPATHNIDVSYLMLQPSVVTPYRTSFNEHFEYLGPR
ncbi:MAG: hypothetical protein JWN76_1605 [Chitinophagaceae bacterium]|nr:hypothetical protein [Chitinophagaceae bacterium]